MSGLFWLTLFVFGVETEQPSTYLQRLEGQTFQFKGTKTTAPSQAEVSGGMVIQYLEPLPLEQELQVKSTVDHQGWVLTAKTREFNPNFGANPFEQEFLTKTINTYIALDGSILSRETITEMGGNRNQNQETRLGFHETISHFYAAWMAQLTPDYKWTKDKGERTVTIAVEGQETVQNRSCFVVRLTKKKGDQVMGEEVFWVDKERRIGIKAESAGGTLTLSDAKP